MGYSEIHCTFCGVSFNIGRIRKLGEPLNNASAFVEVGRLPEYNFKNKDIGRNWCLLDRKDHAST